MRVFVTIGTHEPFDRLIKTIDQIAHKFKNSSIIFEAQISDTDYIVLNMKTYGFLSPIEYEKKLNEADLIISHAGMGTIISALTSNKPIIVMPRYARLGETRNEHQLATVKAFDKLKYIYVAYDENHLNELVDIAISKQLKPLHYIGEYASKTLIEAVRKFINSTDL